MPESIESHPLTLDIGAESTDATLPAFLAWPPGAPPCYGFPVIPETETDGWMFGVITEFEDPNGCVSGDGYVQAPDGSRAGLVWGPDEEHMEQYFAPGKRRWGVYGICFPRPIRTVDDLVDKFRVILPDLQQRYTEVKQANRKAAANTALVRRHKRRRQ